MSRDPMLRIADIVLCCEKILRFTAGMSREQLAGSELTLDAVLRNIEIIGEAAKHVPDDLRAQIPGVDWKKVAGMRDWLSDVYHRIDFDIVWDAVEAKVPELLRSLRAFTGEKRAP